MCVCVCVCCVCVHKQQISLFTADHLYEWKFEKIIHKCTSHSKDA